MASAHLGQTVFKHLWLLTPGYCSGTIKLVTNQSHLKNCPFFQPPGCHWHRSFQQVL